MAKKDVVQPVQFRLMLHPDDHKEFKRISEQTGIPISRMLIDGGKEECRQIKIRYGERHVGDYRNT